MAFVWPAPGERPKKVDAVTFYSTAGEDVVVDSHVAALLRARRLVGHNPYGVSRPTFYQPGVATCRTDLSFCIGDRHGALAVSSGDAVVGDGNSANWVWMADSTAATGDDVLGYLDVGRWVQQVADSAAGQAGVFTTQLATRAGGRDGETLVTTGYSSVTDNGGATFTFSAPLYTADGYTVINCPNGQYRMNTTRGISIRCFGAKGDGVTIDTTAVRAFFAYVPQGSNGYIDDGNYMVDGTVDIATPGAAYLATSGSSADNQKSIFTWVGAAGGTMFRYSTRDSVFRGLAFAVGNGYSVLYALSFEYTGSVITRPSFEDCYFGTLVANGTMTWAVAVDPGLVAPGNIEFALFTRCAFSSPTWVRGGQPYGWVYDNCEFGCNIPGATGWADGIAVQIDTISAEIVFLACKAGRLSVFLIMAQPCHILFLGGDYENVKRWVQQTGASVNAGRPVIGLGGRHALGGYGQTASRPTIANTDNRYVILTCGAQSLELSGILFGENGLAPLWRIDVAKYISVNVSGCVFPNFTPIARTATGYVGERTGGTRRSGCKAGQPDPGSGLTLASLPDTYGGENGSGTVTITGAATSQAFLFSSDSWGVDEVDTDYRVYFTLQSTTNTPAAGSMLGAYATSKATTGFTVNVGTAPGLGNSVTYAWRIES